MTTPIQTSQVPLSPVLAETGFLRLKQIVGDTNTNPPTPPLIPVSRSTWWAGVRSGRYPAGVKISSNVTVWRVEDIRELIENPERANPEVAA